MERVLIVLRHAKSSWKDDSLDDIDRPLNQRGKRDLRLMARAFSGEFSPDLVVTSPARRALATARAFADAVDLSGRRFIEDPRLYGAGIPDFLEVIRELPDKAGTVVLVGHEPGVSELVNVLAGENLEKIPTCAWAVLALPVKHWHDLREGIGVFRELRSPKQM